MAVPIRVLAGLIELEPVVRVLDERDARARAATSRGMTCSISVVLPLPDQPANPKMRIVCCGPVWPFAGTNRTAHCTDRRGLDAPVDTRGA